MELLASKSGLVERIISTIRATVRGYAHLIIHIFLFIGANVTNRSKRTKEDILKLIKGKRSTYGDLPEDFQDAKDDMSLHHSVCLIYCICFLHFVNRDEGRREWFDKKEGQCRLLKKEICGHQNVSQNYWCFYLLNNN